MPIEDLIAAVRALIIDVENMRCEPNAPLLQTEHWFGEFSEHEENEHGDMIVEWPNLSIDIQRLKVALALAEEEMRK